MDYSDLIGLIRAKYRTQANFARAIGLSAWSVSRKLNGYSEWTAGEMHRAGDVLGLTPDDLPRYFFTLKVEKSQQ